MNLSAWASVALSNVVVILRDLNSVVGLFPGAISCTGAKISGQVFPPTY